MRKILFSRESDCLQPLRLRIEDQYHKTLVLWALDCATEYLLYFERNQPGEHRPRDVLEVAAQWARGEVSMPTAKKAIHAAHQAAAAVGDKTRHDASVMAASRAIGHAAATVHVETHALGIALYGLTSKVYAAEEGLGNAAVTLELDRLYRRLVYWEEHIAQHKGPWASFLQKETLPNKEKLLKLKLEAKANSSMKQQTH